MAARPIPQLTEKDKARFWSNVDKDGPVQAHCPAIGKCWIWTGSKIIQGYGIFPLGKIRFLATRVLLHIHTGEMPETLLALHKCDNPICVNPDHLFKGTHSDNSNDMMSKGRFIFAPHKNPQIGDKHWSRRMPDRVRKGERAGRVVLTATDVISIRDDYWSGRKGTDQLRIDYGVSIRNIYSIIQRNSWAHLPMSGNEGSEIKCGRRKRHCHIIKSDGRAVY